VSLIGFGTFDRRERAPRTGRNPQTGATIQLPASAAPVFRPGVGFRSLLTANGNSAAVEQAAPTPVEPKRKSGKKAAAAATASKAAVKSNGGKSDKKAAKKATGKDVKKAAKKGR
jgi:DNA-binding protein HU-beta